MLPLRFMPIQPSAVSVYVARFAAAADVKVTTRDLRSGMAFSRVKHSMRTEGTSGDALTIRLGGQWSANCDTYANDYLHPGYFCAMFGHLVCSNLILTAVAGHFERCLRTSVAERPVSAETGALRMLLAPCTHAVSWATCVVQSLHEISGSEFVPCQAVLSAGLAATDIVRNGSAHAGAMYVSAALSAAFLRTPDGRSLLESAHRVGPVAEGTGPPQGVGDGRSGVSQLDDDPEAAPKGTCAAHAMGAGQTLPQEQRTPYAPSNVSSVRLKFSLHTVIS